MTAVVKTDEEAILREIVDRIRQVADPIRIVLFGSRARGEENGRSDYDILVIAESDLPRWERSIPLYRALSCVSASVDVAVYTPEEVAEWQGASAAFVTAALSDGRVLYEKQ